VIQRGSWRLIRGVFVAAPLGLVAALVVAGQGACGSDPPAPPAVAGSGGAAGATATTSTGGEGGLFPCHDANTFLKDVVPEGWIRSPCMPSGCEVYVSTSPANTRPPSPWADCGPGCLELVHDWGDPTYRILEVLGASDGTNRFIAYNRWYAPGSTFGLETQLVRLPDNEVVFNVLMSGLSTPCRFVPHALSSSALLGETYYGLGDGIPGATMHMMRIGTSAGSADIVFWHEGDDYPLESVVTTDLWAVIYGGQAVHWSGFAPTTSLENAWSSPDGRFAYDMSGVGSTLFFSTRFLSGQLFDMFAWDPVEGTRPLVAIGDATRGGACCVASDGTDMVWLQGSGAYDPVDQAHEVIDLMHSPHATHASELEPRRLRTTFSNNLNRPVIVGGGYALTTEVVTSQGETQPKQHVLTRIADGAYWIIPPRLGRAWGPLLYVDAEDLALAEVPTAETIIEEGLQPSVYTIVRLKVAELGPPTPAE
jgi:hypothetical protein